MTLAPLLLLVFSLAFTSVCTIVAQPFPEGDEHEENSQLDNIFQRAEGIFLRSLLKKMEENEENLNKEPEGSQINWILKRQHPGKRSLSNLEKRQHPGKREGINDEPDGETMKRQHPGKREDGDFDYYLELQKRQHPGRRSLWGQYVDIPSSQVAYLNELSKRQHPGKRYFAYAKRQHPGKRSWDDEIDDGEQNLEKRQHPGKRYLGSESLDYNIPCDPQDFIDCSKGSLLLELLDNVNRDHLEEKRQHPGRRSSWDGEIEDEE